MLFTTEGKRIHLLHHELLKFLHNLRQAEPLDSWQKCKDSAAHLHQQQVHLHLSKQARVQHLPKRGTVRQEGSIRRARPPSQGWVPPSKESQQASHQSKGEAVPTPRILLPSSLCVFLRRLRGQLPCRALSFAGKNRWASPSKYIKFRSVTPKHQRA